MNFRNSQWDYVIAQIFFKKRMTELFDGLDYVRTYIDDLLIIRNICLENHIKKLDKVLSKLKSAGFKVNAEKSFFARNELESFVICR